MPDFTKAAIAFQLTMEGNWPTAVAFLGDDKLAAGDGDGRIFLWNLAQPPAEPTEDQKKDNELKDRAADILPQRQLEGHANGVTRLIAAEGGKLLVSASLDHTIGLWNPDASPTGKKEAVLDWHQRRRRVKRDKSNEQEILSAPGIEVETVAPQARLEGHADWVNACALSRDGRRMISGDDSGLAILWDLPARREIRRWTGQSPNGVVSVALSSDGATAFVAEHRMSRGSFDRPPAQAKLFATDTGEMLLDLLVVKFPDVKARDNSYGYGTTWQKWVGNGFVAAEFSPDGKILALAQGGEIGDAQVRLVDTTTGEEIRSVSKHQYGVCDLCFTADGKHLLTSGRDTSLKVIEVASGKDIATLGKPRGGQFKDWFSAIALSPSENRVAAADIAGIVHVWNL